MSGFTEIEHHVLCDIIHSPFGLYVFDPHHFYSDPGPRNDQCLGENRFAYCATVKEFSFLSLLHSNNYVRHWHESNSTRELFKFTLHFVHHLLNLYEDLQCCASWESWEKCPLELCWLLRRLDPVHDIEESSQTTQFSLSMRQRMLDIDASCRDTTLNSEKTKTFAVDTRTALSLTKVVLCRR